MRGSHVGGRFWLAYLILAIVAAASLLGAFIAAQTPRTRRAQLQSAVRERTVPQRDWPRPAYLFAEDRWGTLQRGHGASELVLGPIADARSRVQLKLERVRYGAGVAVADKEPGAKVALDGGPTAAGCLSHFQGSGVNAVIAIGRCVPSWALVDGRRAAEWVLVENARPTPVAVYVESAPKVRDGRFYQRLRPTARAR
jgi:hypothetical protein